ncbi:hypothetical protein WSK_3826 [Novosphingobium sp. Rr 2-17]|nr:hypothetical protein WSK_3826 [Novosphingobium sp. Rr 2-17]
MGNFGEDVTEVLEYVPGRFRLDRRESERTMD